MQKYKKRKRKTFPSFNDLKSMDLQNKILVIDFDASTQNIRFTDYLETSDHLYEIIHDEYSNKTIKEPLKEIMRRR